MISSAQTFMPEIPRVLPAGWDLVGRTDDGARFVKPGFGGSFLSVIVSGAVELDGRRWVHLSCARPDRLPSWNEVVIPPRSQHVNIHPHCLHLWTCLDGDPLPDFTRGSGSL